jgi:hypothetical protein
METTKSRKFIVVGTINKDTKVFGVTNERFNEILKEGFSKQFVQIEKARAARRKKNKQDKSE